MTKLTLHLPDPKHRAALLELSEALGLLAIGGPGTGRGGSISLLVRRLAEAMEKDPQATVIAIGQLLDDIRK